MFKLATLSAVTAAASVEEFQNTIDMFKMTFKQQEVEGLEKHGKALERESQKYEMELQGSKHGQQFQMEAQAIAQTQEFKNLGMYMQQLEKQGPTAQMKKFAELYRAQKMKVAQAYMKLEQHTAQNTQVMGTEPNQTAVVDVNNEEWIIFNKEYYKLREMEYYAMYKIPEIVKFRALVTDVRHTTEMKVMTQHWTQVTQGQQHQVVVAHQAKLIIEALKCIHMTKEEEAWISPQKAPVMFETWHALYLYFVAVGKGNIEPLLDFVIDGKYDDKFVKEVKPDFGPEQNLFLF